MTQIYILEVIIMLIPDLENCINIESRIALAIKEHAERQGKHGAVWVLVLPRKNLQEFDDIRVAINKQGFILPIMMQIGNCFLEYYADTNELENFIGVGAGKIAAMIRQNSDSEIVEKYKKIDGENTYRGRMFFRTRHHFILISLSSSNPKNNDKFIRDVVSLLGMQD